MTVYATGIEIIKDSTVSRDWWKLCAADLQSWSTCLPARTKATGTGLRYIGLPWDGISDLNLDTTELPARSVSEILEGIRMHFDESELDVVAVPDRSRIRTGFDCLRVGAGFVVEFDLGDFILPVRVRDWTATNADAMAELPGKMIAVVRQALKHRDVIARREGRLRAAFEEAIARIGHGACPLWLRLNPVDVEKSRIQFRELGYEWCFTMLNRNLDWAPVGDHRVWTVADIRKELAYYERDQSLRAARALQLAAADAEGFVGDVAQALISEKGMDVRHVISEAREIARREPQGCVEFSRSGNLETLRFVDGVLQPAFEFDGGQYHAGILTIRGCFPETIAAGAKGRLLADFVDHPALRAAGVRVSAAKCRDQSLDLHHSTRLRAAGGRSVDADGGVGIELAA